ncbi:MAG: hypothetical protein J6O03_07665 [Butyrivibrio sp.]|nr:hypothetical protein [Butyrivibrio sp.]
MAELNEQLSSQTTQQTGTLDQALSNASERQEEVSIPAGNEERSPNFFMRFINFITGRSRRRPAERVAATASGALVSNTQERPGQDIESMPQQTQEVSQAVDPAVRDELIRDKADKLTARYIEFVDAQPIVKVLVKRNMTSLALCRIRFTRYLRELAEKAVDIDLRHSVDALQGEALESAQNARIRERVEILGKETEYDAVNSLLYDNNGDGFLPLVFPQGFSVDTVRSRLENARLTTDLPEAQNFISNFGKSTLFEDNYTEERNDEDLAVKVGTVMLSRLAMRQSEMIDDVLTSVSGLEGGALVRSLDAILEDYTLDMLGKAVLILPNVLQQYIELAKIPFPASDQIDEALAEVEAMEKARIQNESRGQDPYDYKEQHIITSLPGRLSEQQVAEMFEAVVGRAELVGEFLAVFRRSAGIDGVSIEKRAPLSVVSDLMPFIYQAGEFALSNVIIKDTYINIAQSTSRRECEGYMILMFDNIGRTLPRVMQKIAFRNALIS